MRVAVVAQGPTARLFPVNAEYDLVIGVNRIVEKVPVDWWCFADYTGFAASAMAVPFLSTPDHLFTKHDITSELANDADCEEVCALWKAVEQDTVYEADLRPLPPTEETPHKRLKYSGLYALWLAWHLEATEIDCYGVDLGGEVDFLGLRNDSRNKIRWQREREHWYAMCKGLEKAGVTIRMARMAPWRAAQEMHGSLAERTKTCVR